MSSKTNNPLKLILCKPHRDRGLENNSKLTTRNWLKVHHRGTVNTERENRKTNNPCIMIYCRLHQGFARKGPSAIRHEPSTHHQTHQFTTENGPPPRNREHGERKPKNQQSLYNDILQATSRFRSQRAISHRPSTINPSSDSPIHNWKWSTTEEPWTRREKLEKPTPPA